MKLPFLRFVTKATALTCAVALVPSLAVPAFAQPAAPVYNAAATAIIDGVVTDSAGKPLSGVIVNAGGTPPLTATTDAVGHFSLAVVPGVYDVRFTKTGFSEFDAGDQPVIANDRRTLTVSLVDETLTSLRTIGRVTSRGLRPTLNTATSSVSALPGHVITERQTPDLALVATELPGVTQQRGGSSPNSNFVIRGALQEANTAVDGHIIRAGNFGALLTSYIPAQSFGQIEVTKGPGNFGPTAGDSVFGTINLRTPDFAPGNFADVVQGIETRFNTPYSSYLGNTNLLNDRLSLLGQFVVDGTARPGQGMTGFGAVNPGATGGATPIIAYSTDFSSPLEQRSEVLKARYKFSDVTALTLGFVGVQGNLRPQGGAYANNLGSVQLFPCNTATGPGAIFPATAPGNFAGTVAQCDQYSAYNPPAFQSLGNSYATVPLFSSLNPASQIFDNEPQFEAEFKTSLAGGTLLFRPAATLINRTIDGALEANTPGATILSGVKGVGAGSFYLVTNPGNCASSFTAPNPTNGTGASGPCFQGNNPTPFVTANNPCSPANPCYAAVTTTDTAGRVNFSTPYNQTQVDRDRDVQLTYQRQFGPHSLQLGYDYNSDDNSNISGDPSGFLLARTATQILPNPQGFQTVGNSSISYPRSIQRRNDLQLSGLFQLGDKLQVALGDYYTNARLGFSVVDPTLVAYVTQQLAAKNPAFVNGGTSPINYISLASGYLDKTLVVHHNDPQIGFTFSPSRDVSVRLSGGSSTFVPYANQVSGKPRISLQSTSAANPYPTETFPNANLLPETTVGYDLGADLRYPNGLFSFDVFDNTVHNKQTSFNQLFVPGTEPIPTGLTTATTPFIAVNQTFNAPLQRSYGLELNLDGTREAGFGYRLTSTFQRNYYDQLPAQFFRGQNSTIINGAQIYNATPYSQAYGELNFHNPNGFEVLGGLQYTGTNNQTLGPAYTIGLVSLRAPLVSNRVFIQGAIDNLFNYTPVGLGGSLTGAAFSQVQFGSSTQTGTPVYTNRISNLQYVQPRTIRLQLSTHVGTGSGPTSITGVAPVNVPGKPAPPAQ